MKCVLLQEPPLISVFDLFEEIVENGLAGTGMNTMWAGTDLRGPMPAKANDARVIKIASDSRLTPVAVFAFCLDHCRRLSVCGLNTNFALLYHVLMYLIFCIFCLYILSGDNYIFYYIKLYFTYTIHKYL